MQPDTLNQSRPPCLWPLIRWNAPTRLRLICYACAPFLHPDEIPEAMIVEGASELGPVLQPVAADAFELNEAIGELRKYSLVKRDPEKKLVNIHRLVQAVVKDEMKEEARSVWAERTVRLVSRVFPDPRYWQLEYWSRCQAYMPHVRSCLDLIEQHTMLSPEAAQLLLRAGSYYIEQAHHQEAEQLTQQALTICEQLFGPEPSRGCPWFRAISLDLFYTAGREKLHRPSPSTSAPLVSTSRHLDLTIPIWQNATMTWQFCMDIKGNMSRRSNSISMG